MHGCIHTYMYIYIHTSLSPDTYIYIYMYILFDSLLVSGRPPLYASEVRKPGHRTTYMYVFLDICMYVCVCIYNYIYIYIYMHTHMHTRIYTHRQGIQKLNFQSTASRSKVTKSCFDRLIYLWQNCCWVRLNSRRKRRKAREKRKRRSRFGAPFRSPLGVRSRQDAPEMLVQIYG